ncbi:MAG TPA: hypothetical protein VK495_11520, partial [Steroidobacteraceae bacterium]|nr:hypothetical protein [Steroidobacteraceae bacterium]
QSSALETDGPKIEATTKTKMGTLRMTTSLLAHVRYITQYLVGVSGDGLVGDEVPIALCGALATLGFLAARPLNSPA